MDSLIPEPKTINNIARLYARNRLLSTRDWMARNTYIERRFTRLKDGDIFKPSSIEFEQFNLHFLNRSMHQANEACNKLWATSEVYHGCKQDTALCGSFSEGFLASTTIPTLHYANMSALISILSLFGLCFWIQRKPSLKYYNLFRTSEGIAAKERNSYLVQVFGIAKQGWHNQILQTYDGLAKKGVELPKLEMEKCLKLRNERAKFHYDVLGQTTMADFYGVETYFELLPTVMRSVDAAITSLSEIMSPIPNGCDKRFLELKAKLPELKHEYGEKA